ncbi:hypothetical protein BDP27DRAFT_658389 [Rhodocollybia butyracea]|uniref:Uncharacterized protein n=1 Tax=Rhodocollybia butyracea TaxID=206335 RepID=A0A9P5P6E4_9AGAR|nr:hypothetical protein BDP27DRAFT_658389 [Rhodocollybia butyracea]
MTSPPPGSCVISILSLFPSPHGLLPCVMTHLCPCLLLSLRLHFVSLPASCLGLHPHVLHVKLLCLCPYLVCYLCPCLPCCLLSCIMHCLRPSILLCLCSRLHSCIGRTKLPGSRKDGGLREGQDRERCRAGVFHFLIITVLHLRPPHEL